MFINNSTVDKFGLSRETEDISYSRPHISKLEDLVESTKFSSDEIRTLYRGFKQYCPNGYLTEQILKKIYSKMFPFGGKGKFEIMIMKLRLQSVCRSDLPYAGYPPRWTGHF
ncbi:hypothetical protein HELRODRAFT_166040 [Helobdella robusta]|uniref:Uncharacterized protein n=1 Tax=Helobdella robusta TaxID=6412 RepID=T1EXM5_HELRO|nr:hypothetical protein HELRODRAFT_166040 [Helobdella robusta]ESN90378.1 hypothetical protein HELRODRAFT_166040 [Helobdella robusta]